MAAHLARIFAQEFFGTAANWTGDYAGGIAGAKAGAAILPGIGTVAAEIENELEMYLGENETLEDLRIMFEGYSDRDILFVKKALNAIYNGDAAIIWDYPGNNLP